MSLGKNFMAVPKCSVSDLSLDKASKNILHGDTWVDFPGCDSFFHSSLNEFNKPTSAKQNNGSQL